MQGIRIRFQKLGFRAQGLGFRVQDLGFSVHGSGFKVQGPGFRVQGSELFKVQAMFSRLRVVPVWPRRAPGHRGQPPPL